ncbi:MAG: TIGR02281 family clan AA aspartic protease [Hyphomicrobium sp.]|uniref:retropepsin-like aspartic protease family protein n=1 Tax=Hyphomicrobium sp. TaxID=82 RepID=UPI0039E37B51
MSSATVSLFASFALAALGAAGLAYTLTHPGVVAGFLDRARLATTTASKAELNSAELSTTDASPAPANPNGTVTLPAGKYGHFQTGAEINGRDIDVMVDTGASLVALSYEDAERVGIFVKPSDFTQMVQTANGAARVAPVTIARIRIGDIMVRNVPAAVSERGVSARSLLGMSFLGRLSRVEMRGDTLVLQE